VSVPEFLFLLVAGVAAGLTGTIAGLASLASYPALLAVGLPPVTANVTNTISLVFTSIGALLGSRPELRGQGRRLRSMAPAAVLGGIAGAVLLLTTPAEGFEKAVPLLLGFASLTILLPRGRSARGHDPARQHPHWPSGAGRVWQYGGIFLIAIYGGYFGAAAGVLLLALLLRTTTETLPSANAVKNMVLGMANTTAAVLFVFAAPVDWLAVIPLSIGCLVGSRLGPVVVRHAPAGVIRIFIGVAGLALAIKLGVDAYG
jgi:uncharacterized protein